MNLIEFRKKVDDLIVQPPIKHTSCFACFFTSNENTARTHFKTFLKGSKRLSNEDYKQRVGQFYCLHFDDYRNTALMKEIGRYFKALFDIRDSDILANAPMKIDVIPFAAAPLAVIENAVPDREAGLKSVIQSRLSDHVAGQEEAYLNKA